jgi:hypothetical protein
MVINELRTIGLSAGRLHSFESWRFLCMYSEKFEDIILCVSLLD